MPDEEADALAKNEHVRSAQIRSTPELSASMNPYSIT
jgi:hypothetical protein